MDNRETESESVTIVPEEMREEEINPLYYLRVIIKYHSLWSCCCCDGSYQSVVTENLLSYYVNRTSLRDSTKRARRIGRRIRSDGEFFS